MRSLPLALVLLALTITTPTFAASAPNPTDQDRGSADMVARMADASPQDRVVKLIKASDLSREALFVLAGSDPLLVEQVVDPRVSLVIAYLRAMPATEMVDLRAGNTVVRHVAGWSKGETEHLIAVAEQAELSKPKVLETVRVGVITGSNMRFELFGKKGEVQVVFAIAPTPVREERARERLTKYFSAQPAAITRGPGTRLPLEDSSFEEDQSVGGAWAMEPCITRGGTIPAAQISLDRDEKLDGRASVRFHSDVDTRYWPQLTQQVAIAPGTSLVLRGHVRARYLRRERDQERVFRMAMEFIDINGNVVGEPIEAPLQTGDMEWRQFVLATHAPDEADFVKVVLACSISGTAWFDGLSLEIGY